MENLNYIIIVVKNWFDDPYLNCSQHKDLIELWKLKFLLAKKNYDLIKESNYFEQLELDTILVWQGEITNIFLVFLFFFRLLEFQI